MSNYVAHEDIDWANKDVTLLKDAHINAISLVDRGANNHEFFLFKRATNFIDEHGVLVNQIPQDNVEKFVPLIKGGTAQDQWKVAYCVVAVPDEVDQQKDVWSSEEIRKAAHDFMKGNPLINFMHKDMSKVGELVESAVALDDMNINGSHIPKGSWYIGVEPHPEIKKRMVAGEIRGVSVQGTSKRESMAKAGYGQDEHERTAPPAVQRADETPKNERRIPLGSEGPGIKKLQHIIGAPESGVYDEATETAFIEYLQQNGMGTTATLRTLQQVIEHYDAQPQSANAPQQPSAPQPETGMPSPRPPFKPGGSSTQVPAPPAAPQPPSRVMASPLKHIEKDGMFFGAGVPQQPSSPTSFGNYTPTTPNFNPAPGHPVGANELDPGVQTPKEQLSPVSNAQDLKGAIIDALKQGNEGLTLYLRENYGITDPYQVLYFDFDSDHLWYIVSTYILGNHDAQDPNRDQGPQAIIDQPTHTPNSLMPHGSGYSVQKSSQLKVGSVVTLPDESGAIITEIHGDEAVVETATKKNTTSQKRVKLNDLTFVANVSKMVYTIPQASETISKAVGGSFGGHAPAAHGKIKYIVRAFGRWAGGMQRVCVARIRTEHPELAAGHDVNALCAWLKDQWAGDTHWRRGRQGLAKGDSGFANIYNAASMTDMGDLSVSHVDGIFALMCNEMGVEPEEVIREMEGVNYDDYLANLFGPEQTVDVTEDDTVVYTDELNKIFKSSKSSSQKAKEAEELFKQEAISEEERIARFKTGVKSIALSLADAMEIGNEEDRQEAVRKNLEAFNEWAEIEIARPVNDINESSQQVEVSKNMDNDMNNDAGAGNDKSSDKGWVGKTVTGPDGGRWVVVAQNGDQLTVVAGKKKTVVSASEVKQAGASAQAEAQVEKAASALTDEERDTLTQTRTLLDQLLGAGGGDDVADIDGLEKDLEGDVDVPEHAEADPMGEAGLEDNNNEVTTPQEGEMSEDTGLNDVIYFVNDLADKIDSLASKVDGVDELGPQVERVGELAKSVNESFAQRLEALETKISELAGNAAPAEEVAEVAKRLQAIESQPGHSTAQPVDDRYSVVEKSAPAVEDRMFRGLF